MKLITYKTALLAKELGFKEPVQNRYRLNMLNTDGKLRYGEPINYNDPCFQDEYREYTSAPTQSELQAWLRDEHDVSIEVYFYDDSFQYDIWSIMHGLEFIKVDPEEIFDSYEQALEIALRKTIQKLIIEKL